MNPNRQIMDPFWNVGGIPLFFVPTARLLSCYSGPDYFRTSADLLLFLSAVLITVLSGCITVHAGLI